MQVSVAGGKQGVVFWYLKTELKRKATCIEHNLRALSALRGLTGPDQPHLGLPPTNLAAPFQPSPRPLSGLALAVGPMGWYPGLLSWPWPSQVVSDCFPSLGFILTPTCRLSLGVWNCPGLVRDCSSWLRSWYVRCWCCSWSWELVVWCPIWQGRGKAWYRDGSHSGQAPIVSQHLSPNRRRFSRLRWFYPFISPLWGFCDQGTVQQHHSNFPFMLELLFSFVSCVWSHFIYCVSSVCREVEQAPQQWFLPWVQTPSSPHLVFKRVSFDMHRDSTAQHISGWSPGSASVCRPAELALHRKPLRLDVCAKLSTASIAADKMKEIKKFCLSLQILMLVWSLHRPEKNGYFSKVESNSQLSWPLPFD